MARVLIISASSWSLVHSRGHLISAVAGRNHDVFAAGPQTGFEVAFQQLGAQYMPVSFDRTGINPVKDLATLRSLAQLIRGVAPDVLLSYGVKPVTYGSLVAHGQGVSRINSLITGLGYAFTGKPRGVRRRLVSDIVRRLYRRALRHNSVVFFHNGDDEQLFRELGILAPSTRVVLTRGSGVDLERYSVAPLPPGRPVFIFVSRLLWDKGLAEYVEAARRVRRQYPEARFQLLGPFDSNPRAVPRAEVERWVAAGIVEYLGETDDVRPFIRDASVVVLPSYREGTPRSVLEGMAMGRPAVTTDAPGCRETVQDGETGLLVRPRDVDSLEQALLRLIAQPELIAPMGKAARAVVEDRFDVHEVNRRMLAAMEL